jgi:outer membrane protein TolC
MPVWILMTALASAAQPAAPLETLTLEEALRRFEEDAPALEVVAGRVEEARATAHLAAAPLLPVVAASGGYQRNNEEVVVSLATLLENLAAQLPVEVEFDSSELPDDLVIQPLDRWSAGVSASVPLIAPSAWGDLAAARAGARAADAAGESARWQAEAGLVKAAWMASAAEEVEAANERGLEAARAHLESARRRLTAGVSTELDVLQAETVVSQREGDHLQAVADLDAARRALGALMGVQGPVAIDVGELPGLPASVSLEEHPELAAAEARSDAARRSEAAARLRHLPNIAAVGMASTSDEPYPTGEYNAWQVGVQATWVLLDGGARYAMADLARAREQQADADARRVTLELEKRLADARQAVAVAEQRLVLAERALETAAAAEASADRLYQAGLADSLQALDAQQRRVEADVGRAAASARLAAARVDIALLAGM